METFELKGLEIIGQELVFLFEKGKFDTIEIKNINKVFIKFEKYTPWKLIALISLLQLVFFLDFNHFCNFTMVILEFLGVIYLLNNYHKYCYSYKLIIRTDNKGTLIFNFKDHVRYGIIDTIRFLRNARIKETD